jgi:hypothetical protein
MKNPKRNCFAFTEHKCRVLMSDSCTNCRFYKTQAQFDADLEKSNKRARKKGFPTINDMERLEWLRIENARRARESYQRKKGSHEKV